MISTAPAITLRKVIDILSGDKLGLKEGLSRCLGLVCEKYQMDLGHIALVGGGLLGGQDIGHIWHTPRQWTKKSIAEAVKPWEAVDVDTIVEESIDSDGPRMFSTIEEADRSPTAAAARDLGLVSAVFVPVQIDDQTSAIVEFYARRSIASRPSLLEEVGLIAKLIGQQFQYRLLQCSVTDSLWQIRRRVGRILHDSVCQDLIGLAFQSRSLLNELRKSKSSNEASAAELTQAIEKTLSRVRMNSKGLAPMECRADELPRALGDLAEGFRHRYEIDCELESIDHLELDFDGQAWQLFHIAQEGVTHAVNHGQADKVQMTLSRDRNTVVLRVQDNGVATTNKPNPWPGTEIRMMKYRAEMIGAQLNITAKQPGASTLTCKLELKDKQHG